MVSRGKEQLNDLACRSPPVSDNEMGKNAQFSGLGGKDDTKAVMPSLFVLTSSEVCMDLSAWLVVSLK